MGERVHDLMWRKRVKHRELYEAMGLSRSSLAKKMRGLTGWSLDELMTAATVLEVSPAELLPRMDSNHQPSGYAEQQFGVRTCYRSTPTARIRWAVRTGTQHTSRCPQTRSRGPRVVRVGGMLP